MTDLKKIIEGLNDLAKDRKSLIDDEDDYEDVFVHDLDVLESAIAVLVGKHNRERRCEYCDVRRIIMAFHVSTSGAQVGLRRPARFCPECGRLLARERSE